MDFGTRLTALRKKKKLLQADLAKKIGIARATYGAYEQGTRQPDFETLEKLADYFEVSIDYLLGRTDNPSPTAKDLSEDADFQAFVNDPELGTWYKELPKNDIEELKLLKQMYEMIKTHKNK